MNDRSVRNWGCDSGGERRQGEALPSRVDFLSRACYCRHCDRLGQGKIDDTLAVRNLIYYGCTQSEVILHSQALTLVTSYEGGGGFARRDFYFQEASDITGKIAAVLQYVRWVYISLR